MRMLIDIVRQSLATLWTHKLRSFLTMIGIAWGVGSLLLLVGLGEGFRSGQNGQLANLVHLPGTNPGRRRQHPVRTHLPFHLPGLFRHRFRA